MISHVLQQLMHIAVGLQKGSLDNDAPLEMGNVPLEMAKRSTSVVPIEVASRHLALFSSNQTLTVTLTRSPII